MADEPLDKNTTRELVEFQKEELQLKYREFDIIADEIRVRAKDLENQKEVAMKTIEAHVKNNEQEQQALTTESTKQKIFIFGLVLVFVVFAGFLVTHGHIGLLERLITGAIFAFGGSGITIIYFMRKRNSD